MISSRAFAAITALEWPKNMFFSAFSLSIFQKFVQLYLILESPKLSFDFYSNVAKSEWIFSRNNQNEELCEVSRKRSWSYRWVRFTLLDYCLMPGKKAAGLTSDMLQLHVSHQCHVCLHVVCPYDLIMCSDTGTEAHLWQISVRNQTVRQNDCRHSKKGRDLPDTTSQIHFIANSGWLRCRVSSVQFDALVLVMNEEPAAAHSHAVKKQWCHRELVFFYAFPSSRPASCVLPIWGHIAH